MPFMISLIISFDDFDRVTGGETGGEDTEEGGTGAGFGIGATFGGAIVVVRSAGFGESTDLCCGTGFGRSSSFSFEIGWLF